MVTNIGMNVRSAAPRDKAGEKIAAIKSHLQTLKHMNSGAQRRQDALAKLTQARDELRSYLRFMMFLLPPEKQRQLSEILSRIEALIESGAQSPGLSLAPAGSDKAVVIEVSLEHSGDGFLDKAARLLAQMRKALSEPNAGKDSMRQAC